MADIGNTANHEKVKQEKEEVKKTDKENNKKDAEKKIQEAKQLLRELKSAKDKPEERIHELEKAILEKLNLVPESWVSSDKPLDDLIRKLESKLEQCSGALQARNQLDDASLLAKVSGGRALQGVLLTRDLEDQRKERGCLLRVPECVSILGASNVQEYTKTFSSKHQEDSYRKTVNIFGHSIATSVQTPVYGAVIVGEIFKSGEAREECTTKMIQQEIYSSTVKYSSMHMATYTFSMKDLKLSDDAKEELKRIIQATKVAGNGNTQRACEKFYHTYGSHVNQGPLHFGGHFRLTCSSRGFSTEETNEVQNMQSSIVSAGAGLSLAGFGLSSDINLERVKGTYSGKCSKDTIASTQLALDLEGGPVEVSDLSVWKAGLVDNNSTWILTDRGSKLLAVWDVIERNHKKEFGVICGVLREAWEKMTGLQSEPDFLPPLKHNSVDVLEEVSKWCKKELTLRELKENLLYLLKVKQDILNAAMQLQYWVDEYLLQGSLQKFLSLVVDHEEAASNGSIKQLMQQIIEKEVMQKLTARNFPDIEHVYSWLYKDEQFSCLICENFKSFISYLERTINEMSSSQLDSKLPLLGLGGSADSSSSPIATNISKALCSLRSHYKGTYYDILIKILVFQFQSTDRNNVITLNPLSFQDVRLLRERFITNTDALYDHELNVQHNPIKLQSLLFSLAVSIYNQSRECQQERQFKLHLRIISQMMELVEPPLETVLKDELHCYLCGTYKLQKFHEHVNFLYNNGHLPNEQLSLSVDLSLLDVLNAAVAEKGYAEPEHEAHNIKDNEAAYALFSKLSIIEHYHKKLGLKDALCIRKEPLEMSINEPRSCIDPKQLFFLVLHKLMSYDANCRSTLMERKSPEKIHPVDSLLALILCSDPFLRQDIFCRLAKCQLSVPFILPEPFTNELLLPLWAMRSITKEWKSKNISDDQMVQVEHTTQIIKYPMPIVSFMRLGEPQRRGESKSRILNKVISGNAHFFERDLPGGNLKHVLGDGVVDMCWYLPAGESSDVFPNAVTFLNLHGNVCKHFHQTRFLSQISSMCFILITEENFKSDEDIFSLQKLFSSHADGIVLLKDGDEIPEMLKNIVSVPLINLENLNAAEITDEVRQQIKIKLFEEKKKFITIEECCGDFSLENEIHIDECTKLFQRSLKLATEVTNLVEEKDSIKQNAKEELLPLQSDSLWREWSRLNKELYRQELKTTANTSDYALDIQRQQKLIRDTQYQYIESLTPIMKVFIRSLFTLKDRTARNYFLHHLILNLNRLSGQHISQLLVEFQVTKEIIFKLQSSGTTNSNVKARKENAEELVMYNKQLTKLRGDITSASFGLHHLLRELGQVYEAASCKSDDKSIAMLPKLAAELLLDGYPIELMDGDAAHVPVNWVKAVIHELNNLLSIPHMFVLSVLGLQSTGKSTMLNTIFGLTFKTGAGRCTHGANMQLLPVEEITKYTHVLVIDTEGLRTQECDSSEARKHDNELATFIIGLADLTFINISGEVTGDLDDILQTTVHAFLRMKEVHYDKSCIFIHQNSGATAKVKIGQDFLSKQLDKWTLNAAKEENCEQYEKFSDVIQFHDQKDVYRFPTLWKGDPPMAPVNDGYSQAAQKMKLNLLSQEAKSPIALLTFSKKIDCMWKAILQENFVFSFKNTEEITAYNSLGAQFNKWEGNIQTEMLDWERKVTNEVNTEKNIDEIQALVKLKHTEVSSFVENIYSSQHEEMQKYFNDKSLRSILIQWKQKFEIKLEAVKEEWKAHAENHCAQLGKGRRAINMFEQNRIKYTETVNRKAQKIIAKMKREEDELNESLEQKCLNSTHLASIMQRKHKLFAPEKLREADINLPQLCYDNLTEQKIEHILVGGLLTPEQAKTVLKQGKLDEEELTAEFDKIWIELVEDLPPVYSEPIDAEIKVERKLIRFDDKFQDAIINALRDKKLREWGLKFAQGIEVKSEHYSGRSLKDKVAKKMFRTTQKEAQQISDQVFDTAREFFEEKKQLQSFVTEEAYTHELLRKINEVLSESSAEHFTFTRQYRIEVYLTVCGYAVGVFEKMGKAFRLQNDPREYLEKYQKGPLFVRFKNQYYQTAAEEAIATNLCAAFSAPIRVQIEKLLGTKLIAQMKCESHLSNKMALKAKILTDLGKNGNFEDYVIYLKNIDQSLQYWIQHYTEEYCNEKESSGETHLQVTAKREVSRIILMLERKVHEIMDEVASSWLSTFVEDTEIRREVGVKLDICNLLPDNIDKLDLDNFQKVMGCELEKLGRKLHDSFGKVICDLDEMSKWQEQPFTLLKSLCGCTEQCPFCGEQCDLGEHDGTKLKHTVAQHRPNGVIGWHSRYTEVLGRNICPTLVAGKRSFLFDTIYHPYKKYFEKYPNWHIPPDPSATNSIYWKWFFAHYIDDLATRYTCEKPEVPPEWVQIKWQDVLIEVKRQFNL